MGNPLAILEPKRPANCPCVQYDPSAGCGLRTVSASQIGSALGLVIGAVVYLAQLFNEARDASGSLVAVPPPMEFEDIVLREQFWAILLLSALYYLVAEWVLEENDYLKLRSLGCAKAEFWLRVG